MNDWNLAIKYTKLGRRVRKIANEAPQPNVKRAAADLYSHWAKLMSAAHAAAAAAEPPAQRRRMV